MGEANLRERKASPAFQITCMIEQHSRWPEALVLLAKMRALEPCRRPKLGAYQRWIRELGVEEGNPQELAMLDAVMRVAAGQPPGSAPSPTDGTISLREPFATVGCAVSLGTSNREACTKTDKVSQANGVTPERGSHLVDDGSKVQ